MGLLNRLLMQTPQNPKVPSIAEFTIRQKAAKKAKFMQWDKLCYTITFGFWRVWMSSLLPNNQSYLWVPMLTRPLKNPWKSKPGKEGILFSIPLPWNIMILKNRKLQVNIFSKIHTSHLKCSALFIFYMTSIH